jgi:hypothetical protein
MKGMCHGGCIATRMAHTDEEMLNYVRTCFHTCLCHFLSQLEVRITHPPPVSIILEMDYTPSTCRLSSSLPKFDTLPNDVSFLNLLLVGFHAAPCATALKAMFALDQDDVLDLLHSTSPTIDSLAVHKSVDIRFPDDLE